MNEYEALQQDRVKLQQWLHAHGLMELLSEFPQGTKQARALGLMGLGWTLSAAGMGEDAALWDALSIALSAWGASASCKSFLAHLKWPGLFSSELGLQSAEPPIWTPSAHNPHAYLMGYTLDKGTPIQLSGEHLCRHFLAAGMTGVGKTVSSTLLMAQQISMGGGVLWVDGKLDPENMEMFFHLAKWLGRESDVRIVNPANPKLSNTYNFIAQGSPDQVASRILSTLPSTQSNAGSDYYKQAANQGLICVIGAIQWLGLTYNCMDLAILLTHPKALLELDEKINACLHVRSHQHDPSIASFKLFLESCKSSHPLNGKTQIDTRKLRDLFGGVAGRLFVYGSGSCGEVTNTYHSEVDLFEGMRQGQLMYCALPTMGQHLSAQNFGKILLGDLRCAVAKLQALPKASRPDPPFLIWLDEVASYGSANALATPFQQARSAHIALGVGFQEHASVQELGPSFLSTILGNTYNKLLFKPSDPQTAKDWAEMIGRHRVFETSVSTQHSRSKAFDFLGLAWNSKAAQAFSQTHTRREREEYRLSVERLARLDVGQAVLLHGATQLYDLRIPKLSFLPHMRRELGEVVIQRPASTFKPKSRGLEFLKSTDSSSPKDGHARAQEGLFFYKKYEQFLSERVCAEQRLGLAQEELRRAKFQNLGGLHPHA